MARSIQKWTPRHEQVIVMHLMGLSYEEIAEETDFAQKYVGQIVRSEEGRRLVRRFQARLKARLHERLHSKMELLAEKAVDNWEETLDADIAPMHRMKKHQDRLGLEIFDRVHGHRSGDEESGDGVKIPIEAVERLAAALQASRGEVLEGEYDTPSGDPLVQAGSVQDADVEILEEGADGEG